MVGSSGLEPPTSRLSGVRSNHLSYEPSSPLGSYAPFLPFGKNFRSFACVSSQNKCKHLFCFQVFLCGRSGYLSYFSFSNKIPLRWAFCLYSGIPLGYLFLVFPFCSGIPFGFYLLCTFTQAFSLMSFFLVYPIGNNSFPRFFLLVEMSGVEPLTPCLQGRCSTN